jgi:ribonucleotide monophosphatase NagD (HAD superfamily)
MGRALLVRTGKYRTGDEAHVDPPPTAIVADVSEAVEWIEKTLS